MQSTISFNIEIWNENNTTPIDWSIMAILKSNDNLNNKDNIIYFNNPNYNNGTIIIIENSDIFEDTDDLDDPIFIDFNKIPTEIECLSFYLFNEKWWNFKIHEIKILLRNNNYKRIYNVVNSSTCLALELFKFQRIEDIWDFTIVNNPIPDFQMHLNKLSIVT